MTQCRHDYLGHDIQFTGGQGTRHPRPAVVLIFTHRSRVLPPQPLLVGDFCCVGATARISRDTEEVRADIERRSEEHTSELQSLMRNSYAVFCFKTKKQNNN